jgi:hypothetical protein
MFKSESENLGFQGIVNAEGVRCRFQGLRELGLQITKSVRDTFIGLLALSLLFGRSNR